MERFLRYFYWLPTILLAFSAGAKLVAATQPADQLPMPHLAGKLLPLAALELVCLLLFAWPRTAIVGFLLICSYLGGAIAFNLFIGMVSPAAPAGLLAFFWMGMYWRNKAFFVPRKVENPRD